MSGLSWVLVGLIALPSSGYRNPDPKPVTVVRVPVPKKPPEPRPLTELEKRCINTARRATGRAKEEAAKRRTLERKLESQKLASKKREVPLKLTLSEHEKRALDLASEPPKEVTPSWVPWGVAVALVLGVAAGGFGVVAVQGGLR